MNEDKEFWETKVVPVVKELKEKHEKAGKLLEILENVIYNKAGYYKVENKFMRREEWLKY